MTSKTKTNCTSWYHKYFHFLTEKSLHACLQPQGFTSSDSIFLTAIQWLVLVVMWAGFWSLDGWYRAGSLCAHNLWNSSMKGRTRSGSSVTRMFSMLLCTAVSVQLREPVMSSRPSTTANLWCMCTEPTSHRTQIPGEQAGEWRISENSSVPYGCVDLLQYLLGNSGICTKTNGDVQKLT